MSQQAATTPESLWRRLADSHRAYSSAFHDFMSEGVDRVPEVQKAIRGTDRMTALTVLPYLSLTERKCLFPELVFLASWAHGAVQVARDMILSLPRDWVLANIEREAEPHLQDGTYDEYRRFLELYQLLDRDLTIKLARRAAAHADPDIREAGEEFLEELLGPEPQAAQT